MPLRVLPPSLLVPARPKRIILHWTGGVYRVSKLDQQHYHAILEDLEAIGRGGDVRVVSGTHSIADNDSARDGDYAAHTAECNTGSIGLAVACMLEATPGHAGRYPLTELLWERLAQAAAECCERYKIPITPQTVLQHGEVERQLGHHQNGKWDITYLPRDPHLEPEGVCDQFRRKVAWYRQRVPK